MAKVNICNVDVKDNPCPFTHPFQFEITFECLEALGEGSNPTSKMEYMRRKPYFTNNLKMTQINNYPKDLEWKIIYVGSAESEQYDQVLDTVVVGPLCPGKHMFVYEVSVDFIIFVGVFCYFSL